MIYIEVITILLAILIEWEYLIKARQIYECKDLDGRAQIVSRGYPKFMHYVFLLTAVSYAICSLCWMFSHTRIIQIVATVIVIVSIGTPMWKNRPVWVIRIDSIICILGLLVVGYYKVPSLF